MSRGCCIYMYMAGRCISTRTGISRNPLIIIQPPKLKTAFVAEDDTKKHYDVLMGLDLVLEEKELEVTYK